jgi:hypothetical protein
LTENLAGHCPTCGNQLSKKDFFCSSCGKALIENQTQEKEILSFGPWGISICFSHPGLFVLTQQNNTRITLTDRRIYGVASFSGKLRFEIPHKAITYSENINYALFKVLYIQYQEAEKIKEVSIMGNFANYSNIAQASALIIKK